jgi:EAL domain-containing protein (putative c-di-GMP-specific phosphodiesterase class I)
VARAIIRLGHTLNLRTVAEGIEDTAQVEALRAMRCQLGQGFLFAKPLSGDELEQVLSAADVTRSEATSG